MCAFKSNRVHVQRNFACTVQPATRATQQMFQVFTKYLLPSVLKRILVLNHSKRIFFYFDGGLALKPRHSCRCYRAHVTVQSLYCFRCNSDNHFTV